MTIEKKVINKNHEDIICECKNTHFINCNNCKNSIQCTTCYSFYNVSGNIIYKGHNSSCYSNKLSKLQDYFKQYLIHLSQIDYENLLENNSEENQKTIYKFSNIYHFYTFKTKLDIGKNELIRNSDILVGIFKKGGEIGKYEIYTDTDILITSGEIKDDVTFFNPIIPIVSIVYNKLYIKIDIECQLLSSVCSFNFRKELAISNYYYNNYFIYGGKFSTNLEKNKFSSIYYLPYPKYSENDNNDVLLKVKNIKDEHNIDLLLNNDDKEKILNDLDLLYNYIKNRLSNEKIL